MVVPPKHPKMIIFFVGKPIVVGYHHFRKPPYPSLPGNRSFEGSHLFCTFAGSRNMRLCWINAGRYTNPRSKFHVLIIMQNERLYCKWWVISRVYMSIWMHLNILRLCYLHSWPDSKIIHGTVVGRYPAPPGIYKNLVSIGLTTVPINWCRISFINSIIIGNFISPLNPWISSFAEQDLLEMPHPGCLAAPRLRSAAGTLDIWKQTSQLGMWLQLI